MLEEADIVSRCVFSPRDLASGAKQPLCFQLPMCFTSKSGHTESVNCNRLLVTYPSDVHNLGKKQAEIRTARLKERDKEGQTYEGFSEAEIKVIESLKADPNHGFKVIHTPISTVGWENPAHCDIQLTFDGAKPGQSQKEALCEDLSVIFKNLVPAE